VLEHGTARYVMRVRARFRLHVRVYDSDVCSTCACWSALEIGHFGHTLGAGWKDHQHKPQKRNGQTRTKHPSFTLKLGFLLGLI
jgi:hypothetical protein